MSTDGNELQAHAAVFPSCLVPVRSVGEYGDSRDEGLHVASESRLLPKSVGAGLRRLVARLRTLAFHCLQHGANFAADISARAYEDLQLEAETAVQDVAAEQSMFIATVQFFLQHLAGVLVFMADVDPSPLRSHHQGGNDDALDHHVRNLRHDVAVF